MCKRVYERMLTRVCDYVSLHKCLGLLCSPGMFLGHCYIFGGSFQVTAEPDLTDRRNRYMYKKSIFSTFALKASKEENLPPRQKRSASRGLLHTPRDDHFIKRRPKHGVRFEAMYRFKKPIHGGKPGLWYVTLGAPLFSPPWRK